MEKKSSPHFLVQQLRFARGEFLRCLEGVSEEDGIKHIQPMNSISWIVGHLANQEQRYWVYSGTGKILYPDLNDQVGYGKPASTPPLGEMWEVWQAVTKAGDAYLDLLTPEILLTHIDWQGQPRPESQGTHLLRNIYHYWFHIGEAHAIRQQLGHTNLPDFVGDFGEAVYKGG